MDQIDTDALYDERADVSRARPLLQGDVFDGVVLPGFGDEPKKVQIVAHPCAMRTGASLTPRITVAVVEPYQVVRGKAWDSHPRVMPLAELISGDHFAAKFVDITACPAELMTKERRIAWRDGNAATASDCCPPPELSWREAQSWRTRCSG